MSLPEHVFLACRHLDQTEGPVRVGHVVTTADRSALNAVLDYMARLNRPDGLMDPQVFLDLHDDPSLRAPRE